MLSHSNGVQLQIQFKYTSDNTSELRCKYVADISKISIMKLSKHMFDTDVMLGRN
jgi:hypothetical protein